MALLELFMARHREIEARLAGFEPDFSGLEDVRSMVIDLARPTGDLLCTALGLPDRNFTSWLPGMPLAALLATGRRVIVDIAPAFLSAYRRNYGIPEQALIDFARAGMLILNVRDFDPTAPENERIGRAIDYARWEPLLAKLFDAAAHSIYFLSALRPRIFDAIPDFQRRTPVAKPKLVESFEGASRALAGAAAAAGSLSRTDNQVIRALFRAEEALPVATYWHWAYVKSVSRFVDPEFSRYIQREFESLADVPESGYVGSDDNKAFELGSRFVTFQMRMRYAHLRYSAPLSGAFGGAYGYSLDDEHVFMQAVDREFRWSEETPFEYDYFADDLLDLIQDLQVGRLRPRFSRLLDGRQWELLRPLGVETYCRTEPTSYFEHYSDPTNRAELIDYWQDHSWRRLSYEGLQSQMDGLLGKEDIQPRDLFELAAMKEEARLIASGALRKHTEGYQIISSPSAGSAALQGQVRATDPKEPNLLMRALIWLGLATGNGDTAVGKRGDYGRTAYSAGSNFRNSPS